MNRRPAAHAQACTADVIIVTENGSGSLKSGRAIGREHARRRAFRQLQSAEIGAAPQHGFFRDLLDHLARAVVTWFDIERDTTLES